eukprot:TRINITY_DN2122_c0_g1_i1.p1 TRINITY_DN2122_c0_g1~~TRINITY_DN2122_c0_g1_i1.p1  ORF type:complete len:163 (-),score=40.07 TRINITY_DN2122_c0_g1_i1:142-630(-)
MNKMKFILPKNKNIFFQTTIKNKYYHSSSIKFNEQTPIETATSENDVVPKLIIKPKKRSLDPTEVKGFTFFDLAYQFKDYGVGRVFLRTKTQKLRDRIVTTEIPFLITNVDATFNGFGMRRGKAWGIKTYKGITEDVSLRIKGTNKRQWTTPKMATDVEIEL